MTSPSSSVRTSWRQTSRIERLAYAAPPRAPPTPSPRKSARPLDAFAAGVNAYLAANPLPPEYAILEITQVRPWDIVDTLVIGKAVSASLSLDIDVGTVEQLQAYVAAGAAGGFDGQALFFDDVRRAAPIDPAATVPDASGGFPFMAKRNHVDPALLAKAASAAQGLEEKLAEAPILALAMNRRETHVGSNEWGVSAANSRTGKPIIANDPHLALDAPSTFYEIHLTVLDDPDNGPMNVSGVTFAGAPGVILGQNERITWGATTKPDGRERRLRRHAHRRPPHDLRPRRQPGLHHLGG